MVERPGEVDTPEPMGELPLEPPGVRVPSLLQRLSLAYPPDRYAIACEVPWLKRRADVLIMDTTDGTLTGFEIKTTRGDWLREIRDPGKALAFLPMVDHWSLVEAYRGVAYDSEVPAEWGIMAASGWDDLETIRYAPRLRPVVSLDLWPVELHLAFLRCALRTTKALGR